MGDVKLVCQTNSTLGEGPLWDERYQVLIFVDIAGHLVYRLDPHTGVQNTWHFSEQVTSIVPASDGQYLCTCRQSLARLNLETSTIQPILTLETDRPSNRCNDGKLDHSGRYWFGTMDDNENSVSGAFYRFDQRGLVLFDDNYVITNGPAFSPDNTLIYYTATLARTIYVSNLDSEGQGTGKRPFIELTESQGYPDGMTVDSAGCLWLAHFWGSRVTRFSPRGEMLQVVELPVSNVTSCTFGGANLDTLYITTAAKGLDEVQRAAQPLAGSLFALQAGVTGVPVIEFDLSQRRNLGRAV